MTDADFRRLKARDPNLAAAVVDSSFAAIHRNMADGATELVTSALSPEMQP